MRAVEIMVSKKMSLRRALSYSGLSSATYYYRPISKVARHPDPVIVEKVREITLEHPTYGARRIAP